MLLSRINLFVLFLLTQSSSLAHSSHSISLSLFLYLIKSLNQILAGGLVAQVVGKGHLLLLVPGAHDVAAGEEEADGETLGVVLLQHPLHLLLLVHPLLLSDQTVEGLVEHLKVLLLD